MAILTIISKVIKICINSRDWSVTFKYVKWWMIFFRQKSQRNERLRRLAVITYAFFYSKVFGILVDIIILFFYYYFIICTIHTLVGRAFYHYILLNFPDPNRVRAFYLSIYIFNSCTPKLFILRSLSCKVRFFSLIPKYLVREIFIVLFHRCLDTSDSFIIYVRRLLTTRIDVKNLSRFR